MEILKFIIFTLACFTLWPRTSEIVLGFDEFLVGKNSVRNIINQHELHGRIIDLKDSRLDNLYKLHQENKDKESLESRCDLYISELQRAKVKVPEGNTDDLASRLRAELEFGALKNLKIVLSWFESKFEDITQEMASFKNDVLDCVANYGEKHLKSISGVAEFVNDATERIKPLIFNSQKAMNRLESAVKAVKKIETSRTNIHHKRDYWIDAFKKMLVIMSNYRYDLPQEVMQYVNQPENHELLDFMIQKSQSMNEEKNKCVELESKGWSKTRLAMSKRYSTGLLNAFTLAANNIDWMPRHTVSFIHEPPRWRIIWQNHITKFGKLSMLDSEYSRRTDSVERGAFSALMSSCPHLSEYYKIHLKSKAFDESFAIDEARWMIGRLNHYSLGCLVPIADKSTELNRRRWFIKSSSIKLAQWAADRLADEGLDEDQKVSVLRIIEQVPR